MLSKLQNFANSTSRATSVTSELTGVQRINLSPESKGFNVLSKNCSEIYMTAASIFGLEVTQTFKNSQNSSKTSWFQQSGVGQWIRQTVLMVLTNKETELKSPKWWKLLLSLCRHPLTDCKLLHKQEELGCNSYETPIYCTLLKCCLFN